MSSYVYANDTGYLVDGIDDVFDVIEKYMSREFVTGIRNFLLEGFVDASEYDELLEQSYMGDKKIDELTHERYELTMENIKLKDRIAELEAELRNSNLYPADFFNADGELKPEYADDTCIEMPVKKARKRKAA